MPLSKAMQQMPATPDEAMIAEAYIYLLGRALVLRQEHTDCKEKGFAYNKIKYNPLGSADFVNPNFDVAYLEAWFAVDDKTPVILEVPKIEGRYYTAQILDEWGEVVANINERTFPTRPFGRFLLAKPGSRVKTPRGAGRIELHSAKAKMLARVEIKGDPAGAIKLQRAFKVKVTGKPSVRKPNTIPMFDNKDLIGVELFELSEEIMTNALDVAPNAASMQEKVRAVAMHVASGEQARTQVDNHLREKVIPDYKVYAITKVGPLRNGWLAPATAGNYGSNYRARTMVNLLGIWGNSTDEVLYFGASHGPDGKPLDGGRGYVMRFPAGALPEMVVNAYWSVIVVSVPDYRVIPNPLKRYNFNNHSPLKKEADGSLKIGIGPKPPPGVPESNWLPSAPGKPFALTFRTYVPKEIVRTEWAPPALTALN
ncbi:MAG TPA: DUF1214 domain-containing protein [Burkholderiales bacterium]|nr:DUF1214 domain-containing protein [Burkholderiales bacterium]